jgi:uncharacterized SAM-binding protein YcdF (DUF218 family)
MSTLRTILRRIFLSLLTLCVLGLVLLGGVSAYVVSRFDGTATLPADCALVFGATVHAVFEEGEVVGAEAGPGIARRMETAVDLYRQNMIKTLFLSGGKGDGMLASEAAVMKQYALDRGVQEGDLVTEESATSTRENIQLTKPLMAGCRSVVGISDAYHLARIEFLARQENWTLPTVPSSYRPIWPFELKSVIREALGILYYSVN